MPTAVSERFVSLLPIEESEEGLVCGDSVLTFDKDAFDVTFASEVVARKRSVKETVYYVDLTLKKLKRSIKLTFNIR